MATTRKKQLSLVYTQYYHCISRCVRRDYLYGEDNTTGKSYEYKRVWVEDKLLELVNTLFYFYDSKIRVGVI